MSAGTFDKNASIAGSSAKRVRDALRRAGWGSFDAALLAKFMHSKKDWDRITWSPIERKRAVKHADALLRELAERGFIEPFNESHEEFQISDAGRALCRAKFIKRLTRAQALDKLRAFLGRVSAVNDNAELLYAIEKVYLYGSLLNKSNADYGDIDLLVVLKRKPIEESFVDASRRRAIASGKVLDFKGQIDFAENEVWLILSGRDSYISLDGYRYPDDIKGDKWLIVDDGLVLRDAIPTD
ncbi:nucleotidyltransferase domain-containing protein [Mesorhizobium sp. ANAO-SY3R2]|uniref:nucleotidyltransferase domain-containing protein n=1 Tax=Mesorhizobium sp. ANAO-SY3R2 TaxID=3166644 RepID=UPI003670E08B